MVQLLGTVDGKPRYCSVMCFMDARCHGFTCSADNTCTLYDYYPLPDDSAVVMQYYQLNCW